MPRNLTTNILTELNKKQHRLVMLISSKWGSGHLYLTNNAQNITWQDNEYIAMGHLLAIDEIEETLRLQAVENTITLSGISTLIKSLIINEQFINNQITVYFSFLDENDQMIGEPFPVQRGYLNGLSTTDDAESAEATTTISVRFTSHLARFEDRAGRQTNASEIRNLNPSDSIFDAVASLAEKIIEW